MPELSKNAGDSRISVLVFMKLPVPGRVKTRLAASIGNAEASRLYSSWITQVLEALQPARPSVKVVGYIDGGQAAEFAQWQPLVDSWMLQPAGGLGERLAFGFSRATAVGPTLAIGTDCLDVDAELIVRAVSALESADAVFGPTPDGGYYLVGLKRAGDGVFEGIRWSSQWTLADQLERCRSLGLKVEMLPPLEDIDTIDDWNRRRSRIGSAR